MAEKKTKQGLYRTTQRKANGHDAITPVEYQAFQQAYDFFNHELFGNSLPHVLVTLQRRSHTKGYFSPDRFAGRGVAEKVHELALNPDSFTSRTDEEILATLTHEMTHVWQCAHGDPGRPGYHNREWADKMKALGLYPSNDGNVSGKETGQNMSHYIIADGAFAEAYGKLKAKGFQLHWESAAREGNKTKIASKTKYSCPQCQQNAWAKPEAWLVCGECQCAMPGPDGISYEIEDEEEDDEDDGVSYETEDEGEDSLETCA
jgi:predicted SprT family Zn-dependent metalloprotease